MTSDLSSSVGITGTETEAAFDLASIGSATLQGVSASNGPSAAPDINTVNESGFLAVPESAGVLANDMPGAGGFPSNGGVVGVRAGGETGAPATSGVGSPVQGNFGALTVEADGSYVYRGNAEAMAAAGTADVFSYTMRDVNGGQSVATLSIYPKSAALAQLNQIAAVPGGIVNLPAGVSLDDIKVVGRDLVITLPDGSQMVITDGAIYVPELVIGNVGVPAANLAALLVGQEPEPAAGRPQSSGGNFEVPVGDIGRTVDLGDLLPPTELLFQTPDFQEVIPVLEDEEAEVIIVTPEVPAGAVAATTSVNEAGLPARGNESPGSNAASNSETTTGTIVITSGDQPVTTVISAVAVNGVTVTAVGQTIVTPLGIMTITSITPTAIGYSYTLTDNTGGDATSDVFAIVITDRDGDTAQASLTINIADDVPTARSDADAVAAGTYGPETGNVLTGVGTIGGAAGADTQGADGATLSGIAAGTGASFAAVSGATILNGQYGVLTISPNGEYSYVRNPGTPGGVTDVFTYRLTDGDGDTSTATLSVAIGDSGVQVFVPTAGAGTIVDEAGLPARGTEPAGSESSTNSESTSGTITFTAPDTPVTVTVAGVVVTTVGQVITVPAGTLTITSIAPGAIGYTFVLGDNATTDPAVVTIPVTVTDTDGDTSGATLTITIVDDVPTARDDNAAAPEDTSVLINALGNDTPGADGVNLATGVAVATGPSLGTVQYNGDGTFTYTPTPGAEGVDSFTYTIVDGDGDPSTATVTVSLAGDSTPTILVAQGSDTQVDEAALNPDGSNAGSNGETATGTLVVTTGNDTVASLVVIDGAGNPVNVTNGGVVIGDYGTLTVTGTPATGYTYSYTLTTNTDGDATSDVFSITVTDSDGDPASTSLVIDIVDDVPTAADDAAGPGPENAAIVIDAFANDVFGADGVDIDNAPAVKVTFTQPPVGEGSVSYNPATGLFTFTPAAGQQGSTSFTYTIVDGDGDPSTATVTVTLAGDSTPTILVAQGSDTQVDEAALNPDGSNAGSNDETATGTLVVTTGNDTVASLVVIDGAGNPVNVTNGGVVIGDYGTLTVTGTPATGYTYSYTLTTNTDGDATSDVFSITVTDSDGDPASTSLVIDIVDDVPTARNDSDAVTEGLGNVADGNVVTGSGGNDINGSDGVADTLGADGAIAGGPVVGARIGTEAGGGALTTVTAAGVVIAGTYGNLLIHSDGSYTYTLKTASIPTGVTSETFTYRIQDGDGDADLAELVIALNQDARVPDTTGSAITVYEDGLADGAQHGANSETMTGTFTVDGNNEAYSLTLNSTVITTVGNSVNTGKGILTITSISAPDAGGVVTYGYTYTLTGALTHGGQGEANPILDTITMAVTDSTGDSDTSPASIVISIVDDIPTLASAEDQSLPNTVDTFTGDIGFTYGADGGGSITLTPLTSITGITYTGSGTSTVTATVNGNPYFTISVNQVTGEYTVDLLTVRPVVNTPLNIANIAPGNYTTITVDGATFDGVSYANGTTTAAQFTNDGSTINPSGNGFGIANNLVNDNDGFIFTNPNSAALTFDVVFQPNTTSVTISWASYAGSVGGAPTQTGSFLVTSDADGRVTTTIDPSLDFNNLVIRFDYSGSGNPAARVENFIVSEQVIPDDQVLSFGVTVTDGDGDIVSSGTAATTIDLTFLGGPPIPPVVMDLDGDGAEFLGLSANVGFDYDGDGTSEATAWVGPDDGLLVRDANGDRMANDGSEIVFAVNGSTDLEGLRQLYDSNGDGALTSADDEFSAFGVWQDANSNGITDAGEFSTLTELGITGIALTSDGNSYTAEGGEVRVHGEASYTMSDGRTGTVADASFATGSASNDNRSAIETQKTAQQSASNQILSNSLVAAGLVAAVGISQQAEFSAVASAGPAALAGTATSLTGTVGHSGTVSAPGGETREIAMDDLQATDAVMPSGRLGGAQDNDNSGLHESLSSNGADLPNVSDLLVDTGGAGSAPSPLSGLVEMAAMPILQTGSEAPGLVGGMTSTPEALAGVLTDTIGSGQSEAGITAVLDALPNSGSFMPALIAEGMSSHLSDVSASALSAMPFDLTAMGHEAAAAAAAHV